MAERRFRVITNQKFDSLPRPHADPRDRDDLRRSLSLTPLERLVYDNCIVHGHPLRRLARRSGYPLATIREAYDTGLKKIG